MTEGPEPKSSALPAIPRWLYTIVILGTLLTVAGGILALVRPETLLASGEHMNKAADTYAGYLVSRNLALAGMLLALLALRAWRVFAGLMVLTALIQSIDTVIDATSGRASLLPIVLVFAIAFFIGAVRLSGTRHPFVRPPDGPPYAEGGVRT